MTQGFFKIHKANEIFISLLFVFALLKNDNAGVDIRFFKPSLNFGFNDCDNFIIIEEKFLKSFAVIYIEPGIGNYKTKVSTIS